MEEKLTPMLQQFTAIKRQHPDVLLLFRLGDFYELFGDDATIAAPILDVVLTGRDVGPQGRLPMCGVPYHSVEKHIAKLIAAGHRVAICDQVEDPRFARGLVRRKVTRIVTPGTLLEDSMLDAKANNYLAAVAGAIGGYGLAIVDVSTGEFLVTQIGGETAEADLLEELSRLSPAEVLVPADAEGLEGALRRALSLNVTPRDGRTGGTDAARERLLRHFGVTSLRGFGCEGLPLAIQAADMALEYLRQTHVASLQHLKTVGTYATQQFMILDAATRRNLELTASLGEGSRAKSLLNVIDATVTPMGARLLRHWLEQPLLAVADIEDRQEVVRELHESLLVREELRAPLRKVADMERLIARIATGTATARDLLSLRASLERIPDVREALAGAQAAPTLSLREALHLLPEVVDLIGRAIREDAPLSLRDGGLIREGFDDELDTLRRNSAEGKAWIAGLEATERERTGIKSLKVGFNNVFGYYIEVSKPNLQFVPDNYTRKQTMVNAERFITSELKEYEALVLGAEEKITELEYRLFQQVREKVATRADAVLACARVLAQIDVLAGLAQVASERYYVRPEVDDSDSIEITNGRHPVVEKYQTEERFVPNDVVLNGADHQLLIITGPNMAGKSTYLRQVALITLLAQIGSFVPADRARIGIVDRIFTRVGAQDDLASGQSTFMVEMNETANILNNATARSLLILDEIGRGTSTYDGLAIAWAVAEHIRQIGCKTLFATHYHHLNEMEKTQEGVRNYRIAVKEEADRIVWLRKIMPGGTDRSYGVEVARLAGLPGSVITRARAVLAALEEQDAGAPGLPSDRAVVPAAQTVQLKLFDVEPDPVVAELRKLDVTTMTPVEALTVLYNLHKKVLGKQGRS
ncbi:MAG: DNA mismatch repair protein MutS [Armatimonadetes bacterium]|nr:DNA mismatch repair protein MutS [Armatimonadota bacterium]